MTDDLFAVTPDPSRPARPSRLCRRHELDVDGMSDDERVPPCGCWLLLSLATWAAILLAVSRVLS